MRQEIRHVKKVMQYFAAQVKTFFIVLFHIVIYVFRRNMNGR